MIDKFFVIGGVLEFDFFHDIVAPEIENDTALWLGAYRIDEVRWVDVLKQQLHD